VGLFGDGEVGTASAAAGAESVTESAVDAEFVFAGFGGFGVSGEGVAELGGGEGDCERQRRQRGGDEKHPFQAHMSYRSAAHHSTNVGRGFPRMFTDL